MERNTSQDGHRLGERLRSARERAFVGRIAERALFRSAIASDVDAFSVLFVHGPGGIGKSALLSRFADDARNAGRCVVLVDGRTVDPSSEAFAAEAAEALDTPGAVLLVDTFERCQPVEVWFRREFLPQLPDSTVVVVASRLAPGPEWRGELGGTEVLRTVSLRNLPPDDATELLDRRGVPIALREAVLAFAGGHPLALSLAAEVAAADVTARLPWAPGQDVIETLLSELVGAVPSAAHRHALEVCAHAYTTTQELLAAVLAAEADADPVELFAWLRGLPFIESGPAGLFPHDVVRDALDADLRWRDPLGYEAMHRGIRDHLLDRARTARGPMATRALRALSFLHRHGGVMPDFVTWRGEGEVVETPLSGADTCAVRALAAEAEGEESAGIVEFWAGRQPDAFVVYRRPASGEPVGFMAWLRLDSLAEDEVAIDPVVAAAWAHSRSAAPVRSGEYLALARFMVYPAVYQRPSPVSDLIAMRILSEWLRAQRLAWSYMVIADEKFWKPQMDYLEQRPIDQAPVVGGRPYTLFTHDWRAVPVDAWLDRRVPQELFGAQASPPAPEPELTVLSREEFDAAVRDVLRSWSRDDVLAASPLVASRLVVDHHGADAVQVLRDLLVAAVDTLAQDARSAHLHRVAAVTFFQDVPTQEAAAERLDRPFSTYRRHLTRAVEHVCEVLWHQELYGATNRTGAATE
ncbi:ATP-binding protein [Streptacidiphilus sp. MAP12-16]|uniref:ATP-binding protein n=1 Tax=Streptacidiphilus sp. MAP12-16 TaxID=3156300 RepID=UPI0035117AA9